MLLRNISQSKVVGFLHTGKVMIVVSVFASVLATSASAQMHQSKNMALADFIGYKDLYDDPVFNPEEDDSVTIGDVASWTDPRDGDEYALVTLPSIDYGSGVAMVDVTDPDNIDYTKTIRFSQVNSENTPQDVKVHNNFAYVGQDDNNNVPAYYVDLKDVVDDAEDPKEIPNMPSGAEIHNVHINEEHKLLFLSDQRLPELDEPGVDIPVYDISDVSNGGPQHVGSISQIVDNTRSHDLFARATGSNEGLVYDASMWAVTITEYTWDSSNQNFSVTSQRSHQFSARRGYPPDDFSEAGPATKIHSTWIGEKEDYLFTTFEGASGEHTRDTWVDPNQEDRYQRANYLKVWDVSDIDAPADNNGYRYDIEQVYQVLKDQDDGGFADAYFEELHAATEDKPTSIHNIHTKGNDAYISYYTEGIRVLDVTDPTNMTETAFYDIDSELDPYYNKPAFNGAWGVDPYLPSGTVLGSSADGLYVFYPPGEFGGDTDVATRWTTDISVVDPLSVNEEVTVQDNNITVALEADMDLQSDIALADAGLTLEASGGVRTIEAVDGNYTLGAEGQASSSAKMAGGGGDGAAEISETTVSERPEEAELKSNYPNPFNPVTTIECSLPEEVQVELVIYDILGRRVATLVSGSQQPGTHQATWDASNVASGAYFFMIEAGEFTKTRQMMLIK